MSFVRPTGLKIGKAASSKAKTSLKWEQNIR
jgi:hypothetical protein